MTRSNLDAAGRIHQPESVGFARIRIETISNEMQRIVYQLADKIRQEQHTLAGYREWRDRAAHKYKLFDSERKQLLSWVRDQELDLFRQAVDILDELSRDDPDSLYENEKELLVRCKKVLASQ